MYVDVEVHTPRGRVNMVIRTQYALYVIELKLNKSATDFPPIRVWGTVGFIFSELFVNFVSIGGVEIQHSYTQFYTSGIISLLLAVYAIMLPNCPVNKGESKTLSDAFGLKAFRLFKRKDMAIFFIFSMLDRKSVV